MDENSQLKFNQTNNNNNLASVNMSAINNENSIIKG